MRERGSLSGKTGASLGINARMRLETPRFALASLLLGASLLGACARSGAPIGSVEADNAPLAGSPLFAHYQGVMSGANTVGELLTNTLTFSGTPTPRALLRSMQASNPARAANAVPLTVLSYNVGLLDVTLFGLIPYSSTPHLEARRRIMAETVFSMGYDVIAFQEIWGARDLERFREAGRAAGYWVVSSPRNGYTDGLAIAVRTSVAPEPGVVQAQQYVEISANDFYPAPGFSRGFLSVRFVSPTLGAVTVYDSHTAAFPAAYKLRMSHAREMALHLRANVADGELAFVLGDLNAAPYYKSDNWALPGGANEPDWFANTLSYPVLMHYGGLVDLAVRGRTVADADLDITLGDMVPNDPAQSLRIPFGVEGYCASTPNTLFTATDCNALYFTQYAATEFPSRIDFVFARDTANRVHVERSEVAFTAPVTYDGVTGPLSDHYGQLVRLQVTPAM